MKRVAIIEDEADIRADLTALVENHKGFSIVGSAGTIADARRLITETRPEIVLMDIQLGQQTAFDLLEGLDALPFFLIFITAYSQHAIRAIKFGALDYLLKPVNEQELSEALAKIDEQYRLTVSKAALGIAGAYWHSGNISPKEIVLRTQQEILPVQIADIIYCKSNGSYTTFYVKGMKPVMVSKSIKVYEELLPENIFLRPHQSYLVNHAFIKGYHREGRIILKDGREIPVSVRRQRHVIGHLSR